MRKGRPLPILKLTDEEQETLERWARRPKSAQALAQHVGVAKNFRNQTTSGAERARARPLLIVVSADGTYKSAPVALKIFHKEIFISRRI